MKQLLERLRAGGERTKILSSVCAVALLLVAAMLIPLAFRAPAAAGGEDAVLSLEARERLFADYWLLGAEESGLAVEKLEPSRAMRARSDTVMRTLIARSIDDEGLEDFTPTGSEFSAIRDDAGREVRVCRMWLERHGDWQNWLDVCFDADTGELYYYYLSRKCLQNAERYAAADTPDASEIARMLGEEQGWTLRYTAPEDDDGVAAIYSTPGGTLCYVVSARLYEGLQDLRIVCR